MQLLITALQLEIVEQKIEPIGRKTILHKITVTDSESNQEITLFYLNENVKNTEQEQEQRLDFILSFGEFTTINSDN